MREKLKLEDLKASHTLERWNRGRGDLRIGTRIRGKRFESVSRGVRKYVCEEIRMEGKQKG
jgi:hypothetical protein